MGAAVGSHYHPSGGPPLCRQPLGWVAVVALSKVAPCHLGPTALKKDLPKLLAKGKGSCLSWGSVSCSGLQGALWFAWWALDLPAVIVFCSVFNRLCSFESVWAAHMANKYIPVFQKMGDSLSFLCRRNSARLIQGLLGL